MLRKQSIGFGYTKSESKHCFVVNIPKDKKSNVEVYECFVFEGDLTSTKSKDKQLKLSISKEQWNKCSTFIANEFNNRLKQSNLKVSKWKQGENIVERLLGKELVLLLWAIENTNKEEDISKALLNWNGLSKEERWWLFTMVNAVTGINSQENKTKGWRMAIKYALIENPTNIQQEVECV